MVHARSGGVTFRPTLIAVLLFSACATAQSHELDATNDAGSHLDVGDDTATATGLQASSVSDALVGKWLSSDYPTVNVTQVTLTMNADRGLHYVAEIAPWTTPAGYVPAKGCSTRDTYDGTFVAATDGSSTLTWTFTAGTVDEIAGCEDASTNTPGRAATWDDVTSEIGAGHLAPLSMIYSVTPTTLTLSSPHDAHSGIGRNPGTRFTRAP